MLKIAGAFHYVKDSGNFGRNSNGKVSFSFLLTGIFGIHSEAGPHILVGMFQTKFAVPFLTNQFYALIGNSETKLKMTRAISIGWPDLIGKCCSIFLRYSH